MAINFVIFGIAFFRKSVWMWAITLVLSALLIFASLNIEQNTAVVASQSIVNSSVTYTYTTLTHSSKDWALFSLNSGVFLLGLVLFLSDIFASFKEGSLGGRNYE